MIEPQSPADLDEATLDLDEATLDLDEATLDLDEATLGLDEATLAFAGRMFDLARNGGGDALAEQLDAGLPVNLTNDKGDTLLLLAAYHQHAGTVRALLERGADTERVNDRGQTALAAAVFRRSGDIVVDLLAAGADPGSGSPSAHETAAFFELTDMSDLLQIRDE